MTSFFLKIISYLKSEREIQVVREQDAFEISYPALNKKNFIQYFFISLGALFFCLFFIYAEITNLNSIASAIPGIPHDIFVQEKFIIYGQILLPLLAGSVILIVIYLMVIRLIFRIEQLTLHPSYFVYSSGIRGKFTEVIRVKKGDLVSFVIGAGTSLASRLSTKLDDNKKPLYVNYKEGKKKKIMGLRSDEERMEMVDILELYRTSSDIHNVAVAVTKWEKSKQEEPASSKPGKKKGLITHIKTLLGPEPLKEQTCLKSNGSLGLLFLPGLLFAFVNVKSYLPFNSNFDSKLSIVSITAGIILAGGYLLARLNNTLTKKILALQGIVICLLVFYYTFFMWHVSQMISTGKLDAGMGHAPGILAYGAAYGIKQVVNFSGLSSNPGLLVRRLPLIFFIIGGCCDILVIYFVFHCLS